VELLNPDHLPLWLKLFYTAYVCILIPVYWAEYGPSNFLWFSDIALLTIVPALWLESSLLTSMMALAVVVLDVAWNVDFFVRLVFGKSVTGLSNYMFNPKISRTIRALSLFHIGFPLLLLWLLSRLGYDERALVAQTLLAWVILPVTYFFSRRSDNVNWVFGFGGKPQQWLPPSLYLILLMIMFPLVIYLPTHFLLKKILG
jgi:hypothetical protein